MFIHMVWFKVCLNLTFKLMCFYSYKHLTLPGPQTFPYGTGKGENCGGLWGDIICLLLEREMFGFHESSGSLLANSFFETGWRGVSLVFCYHYRLGWGETERLHSHSLWSHKHREAKNSSSSRLTNNIPWPHTIN